MSGNWRYLYKGSSGWNSVKISSLKTVLVFWCHISTPYYQCRCI